MIIHRLTYEIIDSDHPFSEHPQAYVQQSVTDYEMEQMKPEIKGLYLQDIQHKLMSKMPELMDGINAKLTMTEEEITDNNLQDINNLLNEPNI